MSQRDKSLTRLLITVGLLVLFTIPVAAQDRPRRGRGPRENRKPAPQVGETAPTFALKTLDGKTTVDLKDYQGKQPVILVFGSYT